MNLSLPTKDYISLFVAFVFSFHSLNKFLFSKILLSEIFNVSFTESQTIPKNSILVEGAYALCSDSSIPQALSNDFNFF